MRTAGWGLLIVFTSAFPVQAQESDDFEAPRIEVTASVWLVDTRGRVQSGPLPIDFRSDLGVDLRQPTFIGRLDLKPGRRSHIIVEGTPYRLRGSNRLSRTITFQGRQYIVTDTVSSTADVDYVFGGFQFDVVRRNRGHFGLFLGGAYVDATAELRSLGLGITAAESEKIGLPLPGIDFRAYLIPGKRILNINGNLTGMSLGDYGRFVKGAVHAAVSPVRFLAFEAGYMLVDADVHSKDGTHGVAPHFSGPVFSVQLRDR